MDVVRQQVTADEMLLMPDDGFRFELVKGELRRMTLAGNVHGRVAMNVGISLGGYVKAHNLGAVYAAETGFRLVGDPDTVRAPDVAFVRRTRIEAIGDAAQPILAFNPDPSTIDGIFIPFRAREVTMARATLGDGQSLLAFNDLFIGRKTHISARYHLTHGQRSESQSSSGIIVSTGVGSTGWLSSVHNGAAGVVEPFAGKKAVAPVREGFRFAWDAPKLCFSVREPFVSKVSAAGIVWGHVRAGEKLEVVSQRPQDGVIFSDGVEADYLSFDSGAVASISIAEEKARLVAA